jgi:septal ring factor EnvC (AmiA/AmiB activator)
MKHLSILLILLVSSCIPQQTVLRKLDNLEKSVLSVQQKQNEIQSMITQLDETYRTNQTILNRYEKQNIQTRIDTTNVDVLLDYLRSRIRTEKNSGN